MFAKLRRSKSEKPAEPRKLSGMPALKQKRSSKRVEAFSPMPLGPKLTEFERLKISIEQRKAHLSYTEPKMQDPVAVEIGRDFKRSQSVNVEKLEQQRIHNGDGRLNNTGRVKENNVCDVVPLNYDDIRKGTVEDIPEENEDEMEELNADNTPSRFSKGDSGYKSKDENLNEKDKKSKRIRKKINEGKDRGHGLHTIKQQRKASREESVSKSMRALTPKERECIQCLEEVLKNHSDVDESSDEVFDSDSSLSNGVEDMPENPCNDNELDEAVDYGYASINDASRKYSLESTSSVGSIIDLVGNLSSAPSPSSPIYATVDIPMKRHDDDVTKHENDVIDKPYEITNGGNNYEKGNIQPEEALTHLDDVILSFANELGDTADEGSRRKSERRREKRSRRSKKTNGSFNEELGENEMRTDFYTEKNRVRSERSGERGGRKKRDKKSERLSSKRHDKSNSRDDEKREDTTSPKHLRKSSNADDPSVEEPVYAQVDKSKKRKKKSPKDSEMIDKQQEEQNFVDPPSPFNNRVPAVDPVSEQVPESPKQLEEIDHTQEPTAKSSRSFWTQLAEKQSQSSEPVSRSAKPRYSASSNTSYNAHSPGHASKQFESRDPWPTTSTPVSSRPSSNARHESDSTPQMSRYPPDVSPRLRVSQSVLQDSSRALRHVDFRPSTGKVLRVNPEFNRIEETQILYETSVQPPFRRDIRSSSQTAMTPESRGDIYRNPVHMRKNARPGGRPVSLNLDQSGNLASLGEAHNSRVIKPYSSFREERNNPKLENKQNMKPRPFVITPLKKTIQLY